MDRKLEIREARVSDAERLADIYSYYVENTAISFEYEAPSADEFAVRISKISAKYPYIVCTCDGKAVGYAYAGKYSPRAAYDWTVTTSIYVDREYRRSGIGSLLYDALEKELKERGIVNLLAGVAYSDEEDEYLTHDSIAFHTRMGYTKVAHMKEIGKKFDRWYDLVWFQKRL